MKKTIKFPLFGAFFLGIACVTACSTDDNPDIPGNEVGVTISFTDAPATVFGGPTSYGANLYDGAAGQITTGYLCPILGRDAYVQFPVNYGYNYDASFQQTWCYTFYNGGIALSNFHDMNEATYENQLSVYSSTSPSQGPFAVSFGKSDVTDPTKAKYSDYDGCGHIYITDAKGYGVSIPGVDESVSGNAIQGWFNYVYLNNTTYTFLTMRDGSPFSSALTSENKGWFKVQFITFTDNNPNGKPNGYTEAYLANYDPSLADGYQGIINEWIQVDLSSLPKASIMVINFVGSDTGEWGLNTPAYCAFDWLDVAVE